MKDWRASCSTNDSGGRIGRLVNRVERDVVLGGLQARLARPRRLEVLVKDIRTDGPEIIQPDEEVLSIAVVVIIERERLDVLARFPDLHACVDHVLPGLRRREGQFVEYVLPVEHQHRMGAERKSEHVAPETRRLGEGRGIPVHRDAVAIELVVERHQPVGVRRPPAVEIVHDIEAAVGSDADRRDLFLQGGEGNEGPVGLDAREVGEFLVPQHQPVELRRDDGKDVDLRTRMGLPGREIVGQIARKGSAGRQREPRDRRTQATADPFHHGLPVSLFGCTCLHAHAISYAHGYGNPCAFRARLSDSMRTGFDGHGPSPASRQTSRRRPRGPRAGLRPRHGHGSSGGVTARRYRVSAARPGCRPAPRPSRLFPNGESIRTFRCQRG